MKVGLKCTRRSMMCKWTSHAVASQLYAVTARATSIHSTPKCPNYCMHQVQLFCYCMAADTRIASIMFRAPEEEVVVVAEHVGVRGERLQVIVGRHRRVAERNISRESFRLVVALDYPQQVQEQCRHR